MADIYRAYNPKVDFKMATSFIAQTTAQVQAIAGYPDLLRLSVPIELIHRKIWVWVWSATGGFAIDFDLVATLSGTEVYRQKIANWPQWGSNIGVSSNNVGCTNENLITVIGGTAFGVAPWRFPISCDTFYVHINSISAAATYDGQLHVLSQAGI